MEHPAKNPVLANPEMKACFEKLPLALQENILQSGIDLQSVEQIEAYARHYTGATD